MKYLFDFFFSLENVYVEVCLSSP